MKSALRLAWVSPISSSCGLMSARQSQAIIPILASRHEIEVFVDDPEIRALAGEESRAINYWHFHRILERHKVRKFDLFIYCLEDSPKLQYVLQTLKIWPGAVIFYDLNLFRLYLGKFAHCTGAADINKMVSETFGDRAPKIGDYQVLGWDITVYERLLVAGQREWQEALVAMASTRYQAELLTSHSEGRNSFYLPPAVVTEAPYRAQPDSSCDILLLGDNPVASSFTEALFVLDKVAFQNGRNLQICIAGDPGGTINNFADYQHLRFTIISKGDPRVPLYSNCLAAIFLVDDPWRGFPYQIFELMVSGVPIILRGVAAKKEFPEEVAFVLSSGPEYLFELEQIIVALLSEESIGLRLAFSAAQYLKEVRGVECAAARLEDIVISFREVLAKALASQEEILSQTASSLLGRLSRSRLPGISDVDQDFEQQIQQTIFSRAAEDFGW